MKKSLFNELLEKYLSDSISETERSRLFTMIRSGEYETELETIMEDQYQRNDFTDTEDQRLRDLLFEKIMVRREALGELDSVPQIPVRRGVVFARWAVAASILLIMSAGAYWFLHRTPAPVMARQQNKKATITNDLAPGADRATLTLANGTVILLDSAADGAIAAEGNAAITRHGNQVIYNETVSPLTTDHSPVYNTITTPRGGQYHLVLADGSHVWLNAASTLRYPVSFSGKERRVELTGEGYFEIAKAVSEVEPGSTHPERSRRVPFIVSINNKAEVEVLGTHFNINAYHDEQGIRTTLLEGKVKVSAASDSRLPTIDSRLLLPGQQALVNQSTLQLVNNPDLEEVMAWKNGLFRFRDATIETLMRQISRWYDVEVEIKDNITEHFVSVIPRHVPASQVFKILETTGRVHFEITGKKVIVTQTNNHP